MSPREHWHSRLGFILAAAGSAVGLGNIWRFPYLTGENGGGAFLLLYLAMAFTIGISVLIAELAIGRLGARNPIGAFKALDAGAWTGAAYFGTTAAIIVLSFYSVVGGWTLAYIVKAMANAMGGADAELARRTFSDFVGSPVAPVVYHGMFMLLTTGIVLRGVRGGIEAAGKWLMPALFILLLLLVLRGITLPGAAKGLSFYLTPDFSRVTTRTVVLALSQAFFSLSVGLGAMIAYGSYLRPDSGNLPKAALWIAGIDCGVAFLGGLLVFSAVFAFGHDPAAGPSLTFITLPTVFEQMPGGTFFAVAFFVLLAVAALTSAVSLLEVPVSYLVDERRMSRRSAAAILGATIFLVGIPSSLSLGPWAGWTIFGLGIMDFADFVTVKLMMPVGSILLCLFAGWVLKARLAEGVAWDRVLHRWLFRGWIAMCGLIAPAAIAWLLFAGLAGE